MVREIVNINVGNCGSWIGHDFWNTISTEHNLDKNGNCTFFDDTIMDKIDVYFNESCTQSQKYEPRTIFIDLEASTLDTITASSISNLFKPDNFNCFSNNATAHLFPNGYYHQSADTLDTIKDCINHELERCDCLQGWQLMHSLGGGTGSGLGTKIMTYLRDFWPDKINSTYCIFPNSQSDAPEPYNVILAMNQIIENCDYVMIFDNDSLWNITKNMLKQEKASFADLNWLISLAMSGVTSPLRFRGNYNDTLLKMCVDLTPFPRLHFFVCSHAPFFNIKQGDKLKLSAHDVTNQIWSKNNCLANIDPADGKYLSSIGIYRRNLVDLELNYKIIHSFIRESELENRKVSMDIINLLLKYFTFGNNKGVLPDYGEIFKSKERASKDFVAWIPNTHKTSFIEIAPNTTSLSGTLIASTTSIACFLKRILNEFETLFSQQKQLHLYLNAGMDDIEFLESGANVRDLMAEYNDKQDYASYYDDIWSHMVNDRDYIKRYRNVSNKPV